MPASSAGPRTISVTWLANCDRWRAACPAELAPPDHAYPFPCESGALGPGGPVEQSRSGPPIERWYAESPVLDP